MILESLKTEIKAITLTFKSQITLAPYNILKDLTSLTQSFDNIINSIKMSEEKYYVIKTEYNVIEELKLQIVRYESEIKELKLNKKSNLNNELNESIIDKSTIINDDEQFLKKCIELSIFIINKFFKNYKYDTKLEIESIYTNINII